MKQRTITIIFVVVVTLIGGVWYLRASNQLGSEGQNLFSKGGIVNESNYRERQREVSTPVYQPPQWPASSTIDWDLRKKLPKELVEKIDQSPVPVLVPRDSKYGKKAVMMISEYDSNFLYSQGGREYLDFDILANPTIDNRTIPATWQREVRGVPAEFIHGYDDSWRLQWFENGILYYLDLTCHPEVCRDESFIFNLVASLRYVGGNYQKGGVE